MVRLLALAVLLSLLSGTSRGEDIAWHEVHPKDTGAVLDNPGMGWVLHYYDNVPSNYGSRLEPADTMDEFPGLRVIYLRIPWSYLEPEEGRFCWSVLDTPAQRWIDRGKQIALRISCCESWMRYATPQWVEEAGAEGYNFRVGEGVVEDGPFWEPDYNDPVFLEKLDHFLAALAERYDGNPEVAFIDVGSFGVWGEGHTFHSSRIQYSAETVIRHIDLYRKHFQQTLLAANDDYAMTEDGELAIDHAVEEGLTLRDDSILVQPRPNSYYHAEMAQRFWPRLPVILESEHYGPSKQRGAWEDGSLYLRAMAEYHASYASIHWWPREFLEANRELIDRMNHRLGYRLQPVTIRWGKQVSQGEAVPVEMAWRNAGVAPCYLGGHPALTLKDAKGGITAVLVASEANVRDLAVAEVPLEGPTSEEPVDHNFPEAPATTWRYDACLPFQLSPGEYEVFLSVGTVTGTPTIALPLDGDDGHRRYRIGAIEITE